MEIEDFLAFTLRFSDVKREQEEILTFFGPLIVA